MVLTLGFLGAGEVAQVLHLPVLQNLQDLYQVKAIVDVSPSVAAHVATKFRIPVHSTNPQVVFDDPEIDVVFVLTSDPFHADYAIKALDKGKHVFVEKPFTLSVQAAKRVIEAEKKSKGRVFVGYMRRYAPSFTQGFKREVASLGPILYARSRDFAGPNPYFVENSGTFPKKPDQGEVLSKEAVAENDRLLKDLLAEALGPDATDDEVKFCRFMNTLGSHDISLMRETLGKPTAVHGVSATHPFYSAIFSFGQQPGQTSSGAAQEFSCVYESSFDGVPKFDSHLAVYGEKKRVEIQYDSPFVKGLAIRVKVDELNEAGEIQSREFISSYEDAFTIELKEVYECYTTGKEIKTSSKDALNELEIYDMMYARYRQERGASKA